MYIAYNLHFVILCNDYLFFFNRLTNFIEANKVLGDKLHNALGKQQWHFDHG